VEVARGLIGCVVQHGDVAGVIVETEAYHESEPACHAYAGLTKRTSTLFGPPGLAYVYRSYGIHALLNAVCEHKGVGAAVLIRALEPLRGIELMRIRRVTAQRRSAVATPRPLADADLCAGPGRLSQALAVELAHNGCDLTRGPVVITPPPLAAEPLAVVTGPRVGITKATELQWRFCVPGSAYVSRPRPLGLVRVD
jgi:DNA-3-methyladenine glycosylase